MRKRDWTRPVFPKGKEPERASTKMPAKNRQSTKGESTVSDATIVAEESDLIAQLKAQLESVTAERDTLKEQKVKTPRAPREAKAAAPTQTLDQVIERQFKNPRLYAVKRMVVASLERNKLGQNIDEAVHQVAEMYESVTRDVVHEILSGQHEGKDAEGAIVAHLEANYPTVMSGHPRGSKKSKGESNGALPDDPSDEE